MAEGRGLGARRAWSRRFALLVHQRSWTSVAPALDLLLGVALWANGSSSVRRGALVWLAIQSVLAIGLRHSIADTVLTLIFYTAIGGLLRATVSRGWLAASVASLALIVETGSVLLLFATTLPKGELAGRHYPWRLHAPSTWHKLSIFGDVGDADGVAGRPDVHATVRVTPTAIEYGKIGIPKDVADALAAQGTDTMSITRAGSGAKPDVIHVRSDESECLVSLVASSSVLYEVRACAPPASYPGVETELRAIVESFEVR